MLVIEHINPNPTAGDALVTVAGQKFRVGISAIEKLDLFEGKEADDYLLDQLSDAEEKQSCLKKAVGLLTLADNSSGRLKRKLSANFSEEAIENAVSILQEKGYINDFDYALRRAKSWRETKKWGPQRIRSALYEQGFDREVVGEVCDLIEEEAVLTRKEDILELIRAKYGSDIDYITQNKQKVCAWLYRQGYAYGDITDAIGSITNE